MKRRPNPTEAAKRDMRALIARIGEENPKAALKIARRIVEKIDLLGDHPEIGRKGRADGTRELVVTGTQYVVIYRIDSQRRTVDILRIMHSSQEWP